MWPAIPLSDVLTLDSRYHSHPEPQIYKKLSVRLYGKGVFLDASVDGSELKMTRYQLARAGQVILSEIWGKKGAIGIVPAEGEGALCTTHFFLFDIRTERVERPWLNAIFLANYLQVQLDMEARGSTGYASVRPQHLLAATIPLPPLDHQRRLVARIQDLATRIDEANRLGGQVSTEIAALGKTIFRRAFSEAGKDYIRLDSCCEVVDNLHSNPLYADLGVPCVRSPDVGWGTLTLDTALKTTEDEYQRRTVRGEPRAGDIILVREGGGTGKAALVLPGQRFSLGQRVMMLRADSKKVVPRFLLYQILSPTIQDDQIAPLCKGSASPHLNIAAVRSLRAWVPSLSEQERVVSRLDALNRHLQSAEELRRETTAETRALLPAVLDRAFQGGL